MNKNYLKVKSLYPCPKCKLNTLEVVVSGYLNGRKKEQVSTEKIIGSRCQNCNYKQKIKNE